MITAYAYNARRMLAGQGESVHQENSYTWGFGYGYDRNGHLAANTYPSGLAVNYVPNALGQPTKVGTYATGVSYHPNGEIAHFTYGNGIVRTVEQTIRGLPHRIRDAKPATSDVFDDFHDYDPNGNVIALTDGASGRGQRGNRDMTYDGLDRLETVAWPTLTASASYAYDALDNLTQVHVQSPGSAYDRDHFYCYDESNRLTNVKTTGCTTGSTVIGLGYDLQGNVNNKDGVEYHFDYANRLRQVGQDLDTSSEAIIETYRYDGLGRRVQARSATGARVLSQYSRGGQLVYQYDYRTSERIDYLYLGSQLVATRTRPVSQAVYTTEYQHTDALGSPVVATNAAGTRLRYDEYEPYGLRTNRPNDDRPGHTGHVMDAATGLTYMQQRYYDPGIGMFLSVDPVTAYDQPLVAFNRYRYGANNPYKFTDPDGRFIDAIVDVGFLAYDVYKIASEGATSENMAALGADAAGLLIPGATGLGAGVRAAAHGADAVRSGSNIAENAARGKAGEAATRAELGDKVAGEQVTFRTSDGTRTRADFVTTDRGVVETKTGNAQLSTGQAKLKDDIDSGRQVTPVGRNAEKAGLTPGQPTTMKSCTVDRQC